jgi:hypothetical protein
MNPEPRSGCVTLRVQVDKTHPTGNPWDEVYAYLGDPDIIVTDDTAGESSPVCLNTHTCIRNANVRDGEIRLTLADEDNNANDFIGRGVCTTDKRACSIGNARIALLRICDQ